FAPVMKPAKKRKPGSKRTRKDSEAVKTWRKRMKTEAAKTTYRQRCSTAETVNADLRCWRGLDRFRVRGVAKVQAVTRLAAFTYNLRRWISPSNAQRCERRQPRALPARLVASNGPPSPERRE